MLDDWGFIQTLTINMHRYCRSLYNSNPPFQRRAWPGITPPITGNTGAVSCPNEQAASWVAGSSPAAGARNEALNGLNDSLRAFSYSEN